MRGLCMQSFERSGSGAAAHVVEHMLSEANLAGPDIQLRIADYAGRSYGGVQRDLDSGKRNSIGVDPAACLRAGWANGWRRRVYSTESMSCWAFLSLLRLANDSLFQADL